LGISKSTSILSGAMLKKMENEKGIVARFVIGKRYPCIIVVDVSVIYFLSVLLSTIMDHDESIKKWFSVFSCSANPGDNLDRGIDNENRQSNDFIILVC
jgi:hypothetical protein